MQFRPLSQSKAETKSSSKKLLQQEPPTKPATLSKSSSSSSSFFFVVRPLQRLLDHYRNTQSSSGGRDDASLARYPNLQTPGGLLRGADYAGTLTFALTGTITAAQSGLDVFGSVVVGIITSVGGGTIRDAIFLNRKPFWTDETEYIWMGILTGLITFFVWPQSVLEWQKQKHVDAAPPPEPNPSLAAAASPPSSAEASPKEETRAYDTVDGILDTLDAIGLSAFCIVGAQNGIRARMPLLVSAICGMTTATFGGLIRDVLCGRPVRIVHSNTEVYAPPALAGATVYLAAKTAGASPSVRIGGAFLTCMGSRFWAIRNEIKLHTWDTSQDNLGVTIRKKPTKTKPKYRNE